MNRHTLFVTLLVMLAATLACSVSFGDTPTLQCKLSRQPLRWIQLLQKWLLL